MKGEENENMRLCETDPFMFKIRKMLTRSEWVIPSSPLRDDLSIPPTVRSMKLNRFPDMALVLRTRCALQAHEPEDNAKDAAIQNLFWMSKLSTQSV
jgi:hypothetical protein